jgi:hypothetical protein
VRNTRRVRVMLSCAFPSQAIYLAAARAAPGTLIKLTRPRTKLLMKYAG